MLEEQGKVGGLLRLKVTAGGCSGLNYNFELADEVLADDVIAETDGSRVVVDPKSDVHLNGSVVDYVEGNSWIVFLAADKFKCFIGYCEVEGIT